MFGVVGSNEKAGKPSAAGSVVLAVKSADSIPSLLCNQMLYIVRRG